ncbi:hypothetical protein ETAE_1490 [Edwardsiella piscicida]|uniref:Uncharacterized protein n=1 Tax=Edwardsiella piscicida TaxID=1263550 RepID=A0AAU8P2Y8_EDWPI|nr:hypothetical protein ETAE_1490 [Edwardsiella tarda EIB202]
MRVTVCLCAIARLIDRVTYQFPALALLLRDFIFLDGEE